MARRKTDEQDFQMAVKEYLELALPKYDAWFGASAVKGTNITTGGILKAMGYKAGTPDMLVPLSLFSSSQIGGCHL